jgi:hypothetical protein
LNLKSTSDPNSEILDLSLFLNVLSRKNIKKILAIGLFFLKNSSTSTECRNVLTSSKKSKNGF